MTTPRLAYFAWGFICIIWGTTYLGIRISLETLPPFLMAGFRCLAAGALLLVGLKLRGIPLPARRSWPPLALEGTLLLGCGNGTVAWAERTVPTGLTAVLVATLPFWLVGLNACTSRREPLTARGVAALVGGFLGILLLLWPQDGLGVGAPFLGGVVATQVGCVGWAIGSNLARQRGAHENAVATAAFQLLFGGAALTLVGLVFGEWTGAALNARTAAAMLYLVLVGSVGGFSAYAYALQHLPLSTVSLYSYINPVVAVVLGAVVLGEPITARIVAGAAVVLAATWVVRREAEA